MRAKEDVRDLVETSKQLVDLGIGDVDIVAILEILDGVSAAVEFLPSRPDGKILERFDVVVVKPEFAYS